MQLGDNTPWQDATGRGLPRARWLALVCLALVLAVVLLARREVPGADAPAPMSPVASLRPVAAQPVSPSPVPASDAMPVAAPRMRASGLTAQVQARRREFETSTDLFDYTQRLLPAVREGDAEATWLLSRAVDECAAYAADPAAYARDSALLAGMGLPSGRAIEAARQRVDGRCRRFGPRDRLSQARVRQLRLEAAQAGALVAEAELIARGEPLSPRPEYRDEVLQRIDHSGDVEAFGALSPAVEVGQWLSMLGQDVAPQYAPLVWQLAACRMGADCGPQSVVVTSYCVNGGICSRRPEQGFEEFVFDAAVPRQSADIVRGAVETLVERFGGRP